MGAKGTGQKKSQRMYVLAGGNSLPVINGRKATSRRAARHMTESKQTSDTRNASHKKYENGA